MGVSDGGRPVLCPVVTKQTAIIGDGFTTPLSSLFFDGFPCWQVFVRNTQITRNRELVSVHLGGGSGGIDYPSGRTNLGLFFFRLGTELFGRRRIELARHQFVLLNFPKHLGAHVPEVGHVGAGHGVVHEGPALILTPTSHLLQLGANTDLPDSLKRKRKMLRTLSKVDF